jgi:hypothetical protein
MATAEAKKFVYKPDYLLRKIDSTDNLKNTAIKTGAHLVIGVGAGTIGTCFLGKWGFLAGIGLIGLGCYKDLSWAVPMGIGMSSSALMLAKEDVSAGREGFDMNSEVAKAKSRLSALSESFMSKSYIDKIFKAKSEDGTKKLSAGANESEDISGLGVPVSEETLQEIEKQLVASAMEYERNNHAESSRQMEGTLEPEMMGLEDVDYSRM